MALRGQSAPVSAAIVTPGCLDGQRLPSPVSQATSGFFFPQPGAGDCTVNGRLREITLKKGVETYVFRFDAASHHALLGVVARFAAAPDLTFSWHDAAVVCKKVREEAGAGIGAAPWALSTGRFG